MKYITECRTNKTVIHDIEFVELMTGKHSHFTPFKKEYKKGDQHIHKTKKEAFEYIENRKEDNIKMVYIGKY